MHTEITTNDVMRAAEKAVADYGPDWIDPNHKSYSCKYDYVLDGTERHCIVGHILHTLDVDYDDAVEEARGNTPSDPGVGELVGILYGRGYKFEDNAWRFLSDLQFQQDSGVNWSESLSQAMEYHMNRIDNERW